MVKAYGMSDKLGQISFDRNRGTFLNGASNSSPAGEYSEETSREIDCEVRRIIDEQHARVSNLLQHHEGSLRRGATHLLGKETMTGDELKAIVAQAQPVETPLAVAPGSA